MTLQAGDKAPDFTLYNSEKQQISLSDFKGRPVVLLFFPQAFTGTCTKELCGVRDQLHMYKDLNAEILAISVDSPYTLAKWKELEGFNFHMLSDFNKEVSRLYDTIYDNWNMGMKGVSKRSVFVIDADGIIRHAEVLEVAGDMPRMEAIKETLEELQGVE
jgi:glutaredoxin-dependent peroxiredoxin